MTEVNEANCLLGPNRPQDIKHKAAIELNTLDSAAAAGMSSASLTRLPTLTDAASQQAEAARAMTVPY